MFNLPLILSMNDSTVGYETPTLLMGCSSFTISEESRMDEHKTSSRGTPECKDGSQKKKNACENLKESQPNLHENLVE